MIAKVEPLTRARALRGPFDYRVPERMAGVDVGSLLVVPFGRRRALGVVVEVAAGSEVADERLLEPVDALEADVDADLVELGLAVAAEYCSTPARGLALVLPPGTGTGPHARVRTRTRLLATLTEQGYDALATDSPRTGARQRAAIELLASGPAAAAEVAARAGAGHSVLRSLARRGLVDLTREPERRRPRLRPVEAPRRAPRALTGDQERALAALLAVLDGPAPADRRLLLHGVTGSGKTEVYLRAVAAALERGCGAIVLVPEIALTPQTAGRFAERFGDRVAILHSALSDGERYDEWLRLRRGEADVCIGPRSAVFAPVQRLGLIVIDEEHDASYKQDGDPRYDARRVAELRARTADALVLCGSATPRPESWASLRRLSLPARVDGSPPPPVELLGMAGVGELIHPRSRAELDALRERRGKAIVLLNRRGWSNFLACQGCGRVWGCPECDVTLVLHRAAAEVRCHHCGHVEPVPARCPDCGAASVSRHGAGTERLEDELAQLLDPLPVLRLDSDAGSARDRAGEILATFAELEAGALVGTQMVAKGHDFPDVELAVVIDADATLRFPDFRAEERTFALVAQLAGRAGRGGARGRVLVQALDPGAECLHHAAAHDAEGFLTMELGRRRALGYPPFASLIRVTCAAPEPGPERAACERIAAALRSAAEGELQVAGPAPLFRLRGRERCQLLIKSGERSPAIQATRAAVEEVAADAAVRGVSFAVDVDPQ